MLHPVAGVAKIDVPVAALLDFCSFAAVALQGAVTCGKTSDDELRAMINEFDKDGDGEINFDEFLSIMQDD